MESSDAGSPRCDANKCAVVTAEANDDAISRRQSTQTVCCTTVMLLQPNIRFQGSCEPNCYARTKTPVSHSSAADVRSGRARSVLFLLLSRCLFAVVLDVVSLQGRSCYQWHFTWGRILHCSSGYDAKNAVNLLLCPTFVWPVIPHCSMRLPVCMLHAHTQYQAATLAGMRCMADHPYVGVCLYASCSFPRSRLRQYSNSEGEPSALALQSSYKHGNCCLLHGAVVFHWQNCSSMIIHQRCKHSSITAWGEQRIYQYSCMWTKCSKTGATMSHKPEAVEHHNNCKRNRQWQQASEL
jgi:hypothetical protein